MIYVMLDTCVWFSFLEIADLRNPLRSLERLVDGGFVHLLTTSEIVSEYRKKDGRKVHHGRTEHGVIKTFLQRIENSDSGDIRAAAEILKDNVDLYDRAEDIAESDTHIKDLLQRSEVIKGCDQVDARVLKRIASGKAPFLGQDIKIRSYLNDAIIIEKFAKRADKGVDNDDFVFVSLNKGDYASANDPDEAHGDYSGIFTPGRHFTNDVLGFIDSILFLLADDGSPPGARVLTRRPWSEIEEQARSLERQAWYHRHLLKRKDLEEGRLKLTPGWDTLVPFRPRKFGQASWESEVLRAKALSIEFPCLPAVSGAYEHGLTTGALLALDWVLGLQHAPYPTTAHPSSMIPSGACEHAHEVSPNQPEDMPAALDRVSPRRSGISLLQELAAEQDCMSEA